MNKGSRKQNLLRGHKLYQTNWSLPSGGATTESLQEYCLGSVLNVCSGKSSLGLTVDLDKTLQPEIIADCHNLPFRRNSFDTVIVDPPYTYFCMGENRFKWIYRLADIARKRVILSSGQILVRLGKFKLSEIIASIHSSLMFVRLWYVYDRIQHDL